MKVDAFDFTLPEALIAQQPIEPRDASKLLVVGTAFEDRQVRDLPNYLRSGDMLVFNDTRVIPARLHGRKSEAAIEILLHQAMGQGKWATFARPAKKLKTGDIVLFGPDFTAEVIGKRADGQVELRFDLPESMFYDRLRIHGIMPLPPYIAREKTGNAKDRERYQTIFARHDGAVAAPTAGLHFTEELLARLKQKGVQTAYVTLHVGAGTFQPVKAEDTETHVMHREWASVGAEAAHAINRARAEGGRVVCVGTTSLRTLESLADETGLLHPGEMETDIFITPGYHFKCADMLLTNFHLPRSTLFMLVSAFSGLGRMKEAYGHAIENKYRFYSYGDACLLTRIG